MKKSLIKNSIYNALYRGFTTLFPLITSIYLSRVLLPESIGKVTYAQTIVSYFTMAASLGIPNYGVKAIAQQLDDKSNRSSVFCELFTINAISNSLALILYFILVNTSDSFLSKQPLFNIMGIMLVLNYFSIDWFYQGIEEYAYISTRSTVIKLISFFLIIVLVHKPEDYLVYGCILCFGVAGNNVLNVWGLRRYIQRSQVKFEDLKKHFKQVFVLLLSSLATEIYTMLDTVMLEYFHGDEAVGYYSNAVKIVRMVYTLVIALVATFYPRISQLIKNGMYQECNNLLGQGTQIVLLLSMPASMGLILLSDYIVPALFGDAYIRSGEVLKITGILIVVFSIAYLLGHIILMAVGQEKCILKSTVMGAGVNFILNLLLIPVYAEKGAAVASVVAESVVTVTLVFSAKKYYRLNVGKKNVFGIFGATIIMSLFVFALKKCLLFGIAKTVIIIGGAMIVYFASLILLQTPICSECLKVCEKKIKHD